MRLKKVSVDPDQTIALVKVFFQLKKTDIFFYFSTKTYVVGTH